MGGQTFLHQGGGGGGYDDVDKEMDGSEVNILVSKASNFSAGTRIFRVPYLYVCQLKTCIPAYLHAKIFLRSLHSKFCHAPSYLYLLTLTIHKCTNQPNKYQPNKCCMAYCCPKCCDITKC